VLENVLYPILCSKIKTGRPLQKEGVADWVEMANPWV
jgi:hypothetical protein